MIDRQSGDMSRRGLRMRRRGGGALAEGDSEKGAPARGASAADREAGSLGLRFGSAARGGALRELRTPEPLSIAIVPPGVLSRSAPRARYAMNSCAS
jgi:hypothetical protein